MMDRRFRFVRAGRGSLLGLVRLLMARFSEERCLQVASSLTFTSLLSLVPLITVTLTLVSAFPVFQGLISQVQAFVVGHMMPESVEAVAAYTEQFTENAGRLTAVGIVLLAVTAVLLLVTIEDAFNQIWRVSRPRPVLQRLLVYWVLLTIGPVLIGASLSLTSWLVSLSLGLVAEVPGAGVVVLEIVPVLLTSLAFALVYAGLPHRYVRRSDALLGGFLAGAAFEIMKRGFGFYISQFPTYKLVYGTFATVPIFLLWVYLSWLVMVAGAVFVAVLPEWRAGVWRARAQPGSDFFAALMLLKVLHAGHRRGDVVPLAALCAAGALPADRAERLLETMAEMKWVARADIDGWVESRDATEVRLADVYRLFVFAPPEPAAAGGFDGLARVVIESVESVLDLTLEEFLGRGDEVASSPAA